MYNEFYMRWLWSVARNVECESHDLSGQWQFLPGVWQQELLTTVEWVWTETFRDDAIYDKEFQTSGVVTLFCVLSEK